MRPLPRNEIIILSVIIKAVIVSIVVMILLMCRLRRGRPIQMFTIQQTPSAHGRVDIIGVHPN